MRFLLITTVFQPYNSLGAIRVGKFAKYLLNRGHEVKVLAAKNPSTLSTLPMDIPEECVTYTGWLNVNFLPEMVFGGQKKVVQQGYGTGLTGLKRLGLFYRILFHFPDQYIGWLPQAVRVGRKVIRDFKPDLIYASAMPFTSLMVASILGRQYHIPWVGELRDLWTENMNYSFPEWRREADAWLERRTLHSAKALVTVSDSFADKLREKYSQPVAVIMNGFDPNDYPLPCELLTPNPDILRIVYTGAVYPNFQDPSPLFEALQQMGAAANSVRIVFYTRYSDLIESQAAKYGVSHLVEIHGLVPYRQSLKTQKEADICLLLLWNNPAERGVLPAKLFEYLGARRPILAVGAVQNPAAVIVCEREAGFFSNDPAAIARKIAGWQEQKLIEGAIPFLSEESNKGLSRQEQYTKLEEFLLSLNC